MTQGMCTGALEWVTERTACICLPGQRLPVWFLDEHNVLLFDSGLAKNHRHALTQCLTEHNLTPRAILTSHAHVDHTGNHAYLRERYGASLWMTSLDAELSRTPEALMLLFPNLGRRNVQHTASSMLLQCDRVIPLSETRLLVEGESIGILPLPGHSPGHVGFVLPDGTAYLGDLLLSERLLARIRHPFALCLATDIDSKCRALEMNYPVAIIAHDEICRNIPALAKCNLQVLQKRLQELLEWIHPMDTLTDVIHRIHDSLSERHSPDSLMVRNATLKMMVSFLVDVECIRPTEYRGAIHLLPTGKPLSLRGVEPTETGVVL